MDLLFKLKVQFWYVFWRKIKNIFYMVHFGKVLNESFALVLHYSVAPPQLSTWFTAVTAGQCISHEIIHAAANIVQFKALKYESWPWIWPQNLTSNDPPKCDSVIQRCSYMQMIIEWFFNLGAVLISTIKFLSCLRITPRLHHNFILFPHQAFLLSLYQHFLFIICSRTCSVKNGSRSISILNAKNLS